MNQFGYTVFLHKVGTAAETGFGYTADKVDEVQERRDLWNSYTPETCPHGSFLGTDKCKLCGNKYQVTVPGGTT